jgi:hypothetical protein
MEREPSGTVRMVRTKVRIMTEYVEMMLTDLKNHEDDD